MTLIQHLKAVAPTVEVIVLVDDLTAEEAIAALKAGSFALLRKPVQPGEVVDAVRSAYALRKKEQARERDRLVQQIRERYPD